jgi:large subunit ribosomal protein L10
MARPEKIAQVEAITAHLQSALSIVLADYQGMTVEQMTNFRVKCREKNVVCRVVKNRLAKIAADQAGITVLQEHLTGPIAMIMGSESQVDPAKIAVEFAKTVEALEIRGGMVDGEYLDAAQVVALSKVPSRDELYAKMMGSINAPLTGVVGTINGVMSAVCRAIDAVAKQKGEAA